MIPFWLNYKIQDKPLPLTNETMTRLMVNGKEVSNIIERCIYEAENNKGGFVLTKKMKKVVLKDLAEEISNKIEIVGLRPGEALYENLISEKELKYTRVDNDYIFIGNEINPDKKSQMKDVLSSENAKKMSPTELKNLIKFVKEKMTNTMIY